MNIEIDDLKKVRELILKVDPRFSAGIFTEYGKRNIYVSVGKTGKKITVHFGNGIIYVNRPGAVTEALDVKAALAQAGYEFVIKS